MGRGAGEESGGRRQGRQRKISEALVAGLVVLVFLHELNE